MVLSCAREPVRVPLPLLPYRTWLRSVGMLPCLILGLMLLLLIPLAEERLGMVVPRICLFPILSLPLVVQGCLDVGWSRIRTQVLSRRITVSLLVQLTVCVMRCTTCWRLHRLLVVAPLLLSL